MWIFVDTTHSSCILNLDSSTQTAAANQLLVICDDLSNEPDSLLNRLTLCVVLQPNALV